MWDLCLTGIKLKESPRFFRKSSFNFHIGFLPRDNQEVLDFNYTAQIKQ